MQQMQMKHSLTIKGDEIIKLSCSVNPVQLKDIPVELKILMTYSIYNKLVRIGIKKYNKQIKAIIEELQKPNYF